MTTPPPTSPTAPNYKDTLNLPKTSFDMKANLVQREPIMLKGWQEQDLYGQIRAARKNSPQGKWVLHDGPPYANGDIHMGHLINKTLKDIVVKFRTMQGYDSPYVPGWDCHGLPIESAIQKELGPKFRELDKPAVRQKCHDYAMKYVKLQGEGFKRLGIFASYDHPYLTLDPKYEAGIMDVLAELVQRDLVYRQKKPVHWCTFDRTALAEAELEYADKKDHSIYVEFEIASSDDMKYRELFGKKEAGKFTVMIWTTTPWTLPANRAVAVHPKHMYSMVEYAKEGKLRYTLVAKQLAEKVMQAAGVTDYSVSDVSTGAELVQKKIAYRHPLDPTRVQPIVLAEYVTLEDGTGLVHTAPGHGTEDYQTGKRENLEVYNPVLPDGRYDDTVANFLKGQTIWEANRLVIDHLKAAGTLFHTNEFNHSYPHCWRCKKPVIFRATEQWFVKASSGATPLPNGRGSDDATESETRPTGRDPSEPRPLGSGLRSEVEGRSLLWNNAKAFVNSVQFIPPWGRNRLDGMLDTRPDWCISRQRSWGVPIPAFFDAKGEVLLTEKTVRHVAEYFRKHGADSWYSHSPAQILGCDEWLEGGQTWDTKNLDKGQDILDVWFESGASHHAVLEGTHPELGYPAQMYLEGSDQHRGWFQASLLEASGYKSEPPFKQVLTHGFVVDSHGRKMSKSEGNDIKVEAALKENGADVLRLWVASVDYQHDIPCSKELFARTGEAYRKIRNTIRYLLGNLYDFDPAKDAAAPAAHSIDRWMQDKLDTMAAEVYRAYDEYEFHKVFKTLYEFCNVEISAMYAKAIKDRLYCELPAAPKRRASQTVCYHALIRLIELAAPVLVFTAEEAWAAVRALPGCAHLEPSVHLHQIAPTVAPRNAGGGISPAVGTAETPTTSTTPWATLMPLIEQGNKQLDELKRTLGLGNALDAQAVITVPPGHPLAPHMNAYGPEIEDALGCGYHRIVSAGADWSIAIEDTRQKYPSCARSWKRRPDVGSDKDYPDLSARDATVVRTLRRQ